MITATSQLNLHSFQVEGHSRKLNAFVVFACSKLTFAFSTWPLNCPLSWRNSAAMLCLCDVIPFDSKLAGRWKICFQKVSKIYFFSYDYPFPYLPYLSCRRVERVWLKIIWLKNSDNPEWWLKGSSEAIWTTSLGRNDVKKTGPDCWVMLKFFGDEVSQGKPALYRLKLRRVAKLGARFLLALTKNIDFLEWLPSKNARVLWKTFVF